MERIFGIDSGFLDEELINGLDETLLYFAIDQLGGTIYRASTSHGPKEALYSMTVDQMIEHQYALQYCVYKTCKFGVELPEPKSGSYVERTASYNAWFVWWNSYFQSCLTSEQWKEYNRRLENHEDVSMFRPKGDWRDNIKSEEESIERAKKLLKSLNS